MAPHHRWNELILQLEVLPKIIFEILPPPLTSVNFTDDGLMKFGERYNLSIKYGHCVSITDNAMGIVSHQGIELIYQLSLPVFPNQIIIHINTFHAKEEIDEILGKCLDLRIKYLFLITGDNKNNSQQVDLGISNENVSSVHLTKYIYKQYPSIFITGAAFNPYMDPTEEFLKLEQKINAGVSFIITQPILSQHKVIDELISRFGHISIYLGLWMAKDISRLLSVVGSNTILGAPYDPLETLKKLEDSYPTCGFYFIMYDWNKYP